MAITFFAWLKYDCSHSSQSLKMKSSNHLGEDLPLRNKVFREGFMGSSSLPEKISNDRYPE